MRFEDLPTINITVFCDVMCTLPDHDQCHEGICCLHLQGNDYYSKQLYQLLIALKIKLCLIKHYTMKAYGGMKVKEVKAMPVTDHRGPQGCEKSRCPHFLDNRVTDGGEVFSLTCQPAALLHPGRYLVLISAGD
jgi:hypothetical protein